MSSYRHLHPGEYGIARSMFGDFDFSEVKVVIDTGWFMADGPGRDVKFSSFESIRQFTYDLRMGNHGDG